MFADENQKTLWEKVEYYWENFPRSLKMFSEIGENLKQRGKCIIASGGMDAHVLM